MSGIGEQVLRAMEDLALDRELRCELNGERTTAALACAI
jgi:hypothetical protein